MRRLCQLGVLLLAIVCPFCKISVSQTARTVDVNKYYKLDKLALGRLILSDLRVEYAAPKRQPDANGIDDVPILNLSRAHVVVQGVSDGTQVEILAGDLSNGTQENPAGSLAGKFEWVDRQVLKSVELSRLRLRLKNVKMGWRLGGASTTLSPSSEVFLENQSLTLSASVGVLRISLFGSTFKDLAIDWQGIPIKVDASTASTEPTILNLDIRDGDPSVVAAKLRVSPIKDVNIKQPVRGFFPDEQIETGHISFSDLSLQWTNSHLLVSTKEIRIPSPRITFLPAPELPVTAVAELVGTALSASGDSTQNSIQVGTPKGVFLVKPDAYSVINELNAAGKFDHPDTLIPTRDPNIRLIKASALAKFYGNLRSAETERSSPDKDPLGGDVPPKDKTEISAIVLSTDGKIITDSQAEKIRVQKYDPPTKLDSPLAIFVGTTAGTASGMAAEHLVDELLTVVIPEAAPAIAVASWLTVSYSVSPEIGVWVGYRVVGVSTFLSKKWVKKLLGEAADETADDLVDGFVSAIIDKEPSPEAYRLLGMNPRPYSLEPVLFSNLQNPPEAYYGDDIGTQFLTYLTGIRPKPLTDSEKQMLKRLRTDPKLQIQFRDLSDEDLKLSADYSKELFSQQQRTDYNSIANVITVQQGSQKNTNETLAGPEIAAEYARAAEQKKRDAQPRSLQPAGTAGNSDSQSSNEPVESGPKPTPPPSTPQPPEPPPPPPPQPLPPQPDLPVTPPSR
jgi:hypothetical protein